MKYITILILSLVPFLGTAVGLGVSPIFNSSNSAGTPIVITGAFKENGFTNGFVIS